MLTLFIALAIQAAWPADRDDKGWTRHGLTDNGATLLFTKPGPRANLIWMRQEMRVPDELRTLSAVVLVEANCTERQTRSLQGTDYTGANMSGTSESWDGSRAWRYPLPNTLMEVVLDEACA